MTKFKKNNVSHCKHTLRTLFLCVTLSLFAGMDTFPLYAGNTPVSELLIINSYNESAPWVQPYITLFLKESAMDKSLNCNVVHMNSTVIRDESLYRKIEQGIFNRYRNDHPEYLVLIGEMAFSMRDRMKKEWGDIPMLFLGAKDQVGVNELYLTGDTSFPSTEQKPLADLRQDYNFTFIEIPDKYKETVDMMMQMQPGMKKLVFASDELVVNIELGKRIKEYLETEYPNVEYEWIVASENSRSEIQDMLFSEDMTVGILLSSWYYARPSVWGYPMLVTGDFKLISSSLHPVFSLKEVYLDAGAIGGCYADTKKILENCKSALREMLEKGDVRHLPFFYHKEYIPKVNFERLQISSIPESFCPDNAVILHKPQTLWQLYSWQIVMVIALCLIILVALGFMVVFQRRRMAFMESRNKLVNNMPICYITGKVTKNSDGKVCGVKLLSSNYESDKLVELNTEGCQVNKLFNTTYLLEILDSFYKNQRSVRFTHYFEKTDTYYNFQVCPTMKDDEVELFGVNTTEEEKKGKTLKDTSKTLEMTLAVAHIVPWKWDVKKRIISCESNRIFSHLNIPKQEGSTICTHVIEEKEYFQRIHPDDLEKVKQLYQSLLDGRKSYVKGEFRILSEEQGQSRTDWVEINASVSKFDANQQPEELIGSLLLITARKQQEANLIAAKEAARESDRLKSAFLANMSHEIRTPLNAIVGFSNLLTTTEDQEQKQKFINIIENNNQLLLQLVGDILDLAKVEANTLEFVNRPTDINELIRGLEETIRSKVQPGVVLNYTLGAADCCIETEPNRLSQVLINLLNNACKFTSTGSITFGYEVQDQDLYFFVRDTGCGMTSEGLSRIFQRFVKLNNFAQGTGLGLSISKSIVEKMGGKIGAESKGEGKGSTFWFTIPYKPAAIQKKEQQKEETAKEVVEQDKVTLLVAEDNESNYLLFESILSSHYKLLHAWDGVEAVELFKEHHPQLIIMDINMPRMDGYEATREIRKVSTSVPIIAVTAYAFASDKERIMDSGFNSYVSKPINAKKLNDELKSALENTFILL